MVPGVPVISQAVFVNIHCTSQDVESIVTQLQRSWLKLSAQLLGIDQIAQVPLCKILVEGLSAIKHAARSFNTICSRAG